MLSATYRAQTYQISNLGRSIWKICLEGMAVSLLYFGIRVGITNWSSHDGLSIHLA